MARPRTGRNGKSVKLYLNDEIRRKADKLAFKRGTSLSDLVERLLEKTVRAASYR